MGEYVKIGAVHRKIGTCTQLYYARYEQMVKLGNRTADDVSVYLNPKHKFMYRFPFPDEDDQDVGDYMDFRFDRGELIVANNKVFDIFHTDDCFLKHEPSEILHRTVYFEITQQTVFDGKLATMVRCPFCKERSILELEEAERLDAYATKQLKRFPYLQTLIRRALDGYQTELKTK